MVTIQVSDRTLHHLGKRRAVTWGIRTDDPSPSDDAPSNEELIELVSAQRNLIQGLNQQIEQQASRIKDLEAEIGKLRDRLGRNPRNSDVPPSSEGLTKPPANRAERRAQKRRQGKQPGSEGRHLAQVARPDEVVTHVPPRCKSCDADLAGGEVSGIETRQVFEVPQIKAHVTEHRMLRLRCRCGAETKALATRRGHRSGLLRASGCGQWLPTWPSTSTSPTTAWPSCSTMCWGIDLSRSGALTSMVAEAGSGMHSGCSQRSSATCPDRRPGGHTSTRPEPGGR